MPATNDQGQWTVLGAALVSAGLACLSTVYLTSKWYSQPKPDATEHEPELAVIKTEVAKQDPYTVEPRQGQVAHATHVGPRGTAHL